MARTPIQRGYVPKTPANVDDMGTYGEIPPEFLQYGVDEFVRAFGREPETDGDFSAVQEIIDGGPDTADNLAARASDTDNRYNMPQSDERPAKQYGTEDRGDRHIQDEAAPVRNNREMDEYFDPKRKVLKAIPNGMAEDDMPETDTLDYVSPDEYVQSPDFERRMGPGSVGPSPTQIGRLTDPQMMGGPASINQQGPVPGGTNFSQSPDLVQMLLKTILGGR